jgi:hypothetical protein
MDAIPSAILAAMGVVPSGRIYAFFLQIACVRLIVHVHQVVCNRTRLLRGHGRLLMRICLHVRPRVPGRLAEQDAVNVKMSRVKASETVSCQRARDTEGRHMPWCPAGARKVLSECRGCVRVLSPQCSEPCL